MAGDRCLQRGEGCGDARCRSDPPHVIAIMSAAAKPNEMQLGQECRVCTTATLTQDKSQQGEE